jgi:hypothetical protein
MTTDLEIGVGVLTMKLDVDGWFPGREVELLPQHKGRLLRLKAFGSFILKDGIIFASFVRGNV